MKKPFSDRVIISWQGYFLACFMLLILPLELLISAILAASVHELCHLIALRLCDAKVLRIRIGGCSASIDTTPLPLAKELLGALAGPVGGFLCLFAAKHYPLVALFGFIQGLYNLLPIYPMDGGRILRCLAQLCIPNHADIFCALTGNVVASIMLFSGLFLTYRTGMVIFMFVSLFVFLRSCPKRKIPCNTAGFWVQ